MAQIIAIAQQKGGAGKSTVAAHLAVALSQQGKRVTLIDIDPQGTLSKWYGLREEKLGQGYTGLNFVSMSGWRVSASVFQYEKNSDFIIIDSPPHTDTEAKSAIRAAHLVIVPMQPSPTDLWATKATIDFAKASNKQVKVLLNRYNPNSKMGREIAAEMQDVMEHYLGNRVLFSSCLLQGKCVTETDPHSLASNEVKAVLSEVMSLLAVDELVEA